MIYLIGPNFYDSKMTEARSGAASQPHVGAICDGTPQPGRLVRQCVLGQHVSQT